METYDFEYDGTTLSDMGYILCQFDSSGMQTITGGSKISFQMVSALRGSRHELAGSSYDECLSATLQICKNPETHENLEISTDELRELMRWLNRKEFHKFKLLDDNYTNLYFEASFNISRIEINGKLNGLELEMTTNRPFALQESRYITISAGPSGGSATIYDTSDEEGFLYPYMEITVLEDGCLDISSVLRDYYNQRADCEKSEIPILEERLTRIKDCKRGEVITLDYPIIKTSLGPDTPTPHKIEQDFNWNFFRIFNTFNNRLNELEISLSCEIKIRYSPIVKVGI